MGRRAELWSLNLTNQYGAGKGQYRDVAASVLKYSDTTRLAGFLLSAFIITGHAGACLDCTTGTARVSLSQEVYRCAGLPAAGDAENRSVVTLHIARKGVSQHRPNRARVAVLGLIEYGN